MNDAQTWTLIGGFFGLVALFGSMLTQVVKSTIRAEVAQVGKRLARVEAIIARWGTTGEASS